MAQITKQLHIKAVIFKEGDWWVGQCLEHDIAAQAKTPKDLAYEIQRVLMGHIVVSKQEGLVPFANIPKAPDRYWQLFTNSLQLSPNNFNFKLSPDVQVPTPELYLIA
jgi:predicted RNase H-like HicB family nuclease